MGNKEKKKETILNFINRFTANGTRQEVIDCFQNGCCYWFAYILEERFFDNFPSYSDIYYDEVINHFGYYDQESDCVYDITGDVTNKYNWVSWHEVSKNDFLHKKRIERDCIMF